MTAFTVIPSSLMVCAGEQAVFQCRYPGARIYWGIVGSGLVRSSVTITTSAGGQTNGTLTIIALTKYNGTKVVCAALQNYFETYSWPPVILTIWHNSKPEKQCSNTQKLIH